MAHESLVPTEEERLLARTAEAFLGRAAPMSRVRPLREHSTYDRRLYTEMGELGWLRLALSERHGGAGLGVSGAVVIAERLGRCLAPEPFLASAVLAAPLLAEGTGRACRDELERALLGVGVVALAYLEAGSSRHSVHHVATQATVGGRGFRLRGQKSHVLGALGADVLVVVARTEGAEGARAGLSLFMVRACAAGVTIDRQARIDGRDVAVVTLKDVEVGASALLGRAGAAAGALERAFDRATVVLCSEMVGAMEEAFGRTVSYLKERKQFGVPIGSFQALKHRAARLYVLIELARAATWSAARALDAGDAQAPALVSAAKVMCSEAYLQVADEAVQMHGGVGMTEEHDVGLFLKHARACAVTFGDPTHHRNRFATLRGY